MLLVLVGFGVVDLPSSLLIIPFAFFAGLLFPGMHVFHRSYTGIDTLNNPGILFHHPDVPFSGTFFPLSVHRPNPSDLPLQSSTHAGRHGDTLADAYAPISPLFFYSLVWIAVVIMIFFVLGHSTL